MGLEGREDQRFSFGRARRIRNHFITKGGISGDCNYNSWQIAGCRVIMGSFQALFVPGSLRNLPFSVSWCLCTLCSHKFPRSRTRRALPLSQGFCLGPRSQCRFERRVSCFPALKIPPEQVLGCPNSPLPWEPYLAELVRGTEVKVPRRKGLLRQYKKDEGAHPVPGGRAGVQVPR